MIVLLGEAPGGDESYRVPFSAASATALRSKMGDAFVDSVIDVKLNVCQRAQPRSGKGRRFSAAEKQLAIESTIAAMVLIDATRGHFLTIVVAGMRLAKAIGLLVPPNYDGELKYFDRCLLPEKYDAYIGAGADPDCYVIPHPSGVNRWWNDPKNRRAAWRFAEKMARAR